MAKLVAIYKKPEDVNAFEEKYKEHLELVAKVPGLKATRISRAQKTLMGEELYLVAELLFEDKDAWKAAMKSPENDAAGKQLMTFAKDLVSMYYMEEDA